MYVLKNCSKCNTEKLLDDFYRLSHCQYGVSNVCKQCGADQRRAYYQNNKEVTIERAKEWAKNNSEKRRDVVRKSDLKHIDKKRERGMDYYRRKKSENPEAERLKGRLAMSIRRARMLKVVNDITVDQTKKCLQLANNTCTYCGRLCAKLTIDHFQPISKGGGNTISNIIPCCKSCNSSKHASVAEDWIYEKYGVNGLGRALVFLDKVAGL